MAKPAGERRPADVRVDVRDGGVPSGEATIVAIDG
jgi:hypothetical protein